MGYCARYHVASLAAVFLALAVGILIGAAFGADVLEDVGQDLEESLKGDLDDANAQIDDLEDELDRRAALRRDGRIRRWRRTRCRVASLALVAFGDRPDAIREDMLAALDADRRRG